MRYLPFLPLPFLCTMFKCECLLCKTSQESLLYHIFILRDILDAKELQYYRTLLWSGKGDGNGEKSSKETGITPEFLTWSKLALLKLVPTVKESDRWKSMQSITKVKIPDSKILGLWLLVKITTSHFCVSSCCSASNKCKIHIYMKCKWNIHQNGADAGL